jgi:hypothetical protein
MMSVTEQVRKAASELGKFSAADLGRHLGIQTYADAEKVRGVIKAFKKTGEIVSIDRGLYIYHGREKRRTKMDVIWHLARSHRQFDTDEIERLAGAKRATVLEYLYYLRKLGYLRQVRPGHWQLVNDPGPQTPANNVKCEKSRKSRERKNEKRNHEV